MCTCLTTAKWDPALRHFTQKRKWSIYGVSYFPHPSIFRHTLMGPDLKVGQVRWRVNLPGPSWFDFPPFGELVWTRPDCSMLTEGCEPYADFSKSVWWKWCWHNCFKKRKKNGTIVWMWGGESTSASELFCYLVLFYK